jgi:hypothetical protein
MSKLCSYTGRLIHKNYQMEGGGGEIPYDQDGTGTGWNW